jgi:nucleoid-associated protein
MTITIKQLAIHFIHKQAASEQLQVTKGPEHINITERLTQFVSNLHQIYNAKGTKGYGLFADSSEPMAEPAVLPFNAIMEQYFEEQLSFYDFSVQSLNLLVKQLTHYDLAETGYLFLVHYELLGGEYLFVAVIPVSDHFSVDQALNISADKHLDTAKLQLAARIDLFDYRKHADSKRYLSFIKGRAGRKVSDFFLDFLNAVEGVDPKAQSQALVQAVEDYVAVVSLDPEEKQATRKELVSYCKEQHQLGATVKLTEVAEILPKDENVADFYQFCHQNDYPVEDEFPHEQSVINKAAKYSGYGNGISISFERRHFGQDVVYNKEQDSLTIYKIPPNLKEQLMALIAQQSNKS